MASHNCELFGHIRYRSELSYNELYAIEADLIDELHAALSRLGADHIDLVGQGDALRAQCMFAEYDEALFHALCDAMAAFLPASKVRGRLLFVHKDLAMIHLYCFHDTGWKEAIVDTSDAACVMGKDAVPLIVPSEEAYTPAAREPETE